MKERLKMLFNLIFGIYCFECKKYYDPHTEVYLHILHEGSITCEHDHLLGYEWDLQWIDYWKDNNENN